MRQERASAAIGTSSGPRASSVGARGGCRLAGRAASGRAVRADGGILALRTLRLEPDARFADSRPMTTDRDELSRKALAIHERLCAVYGCPIPYFHSFDPLSELISSLLSHRTRNAESGRAFKALRARYPDCV